MALIFPEPGFTGPGIEGGNGSGTTHITSAALVDPLAEYWLHIHVTLCSVGPELGFDQETR